MNRKSRSETPRPSKALEAQLAAKAKRGDKDAANALILSVYRYIRQIAGRHARIRNGITRFSPIDPADLASEYVVFMYGRLPHYKPSRGRLTTFTAMCLRHHHCKQVRRDLSSLKGRTNAEETSHRISKGRTDCVFDITPDASADPTKAAERSEMTEAVRDAMKGLPENQASLVKAYYWDGKTAKALGAELGVSKQYVAQVIGRALDRIVERLHKAA